MKKILLALTLGTGCLSQPPRTIDEYIPENYADREEWDGSKGEFPPGRILKSNRTIDYSGHGLGYNGHAQHHYHMKRHGK